MPSMPLRAIDGRPAPPIPRVLVVSASAAARAALISRTPEFACQTAPARDKIAFSPHGVQIDPQENSDEETGNDRYKAGCSKRQTGSERRDSGQRGFGMR